MPSPQRKKSVGQLMAEIDAASWARDIAYYERLKSMRADWADRGVIDLSLVDRRIAENRQRMIDQYGAGIEKLL